MLLDTLWQTAEMAYWVNVLAAKPGESNPRVPHGGRRKLTHEICPLTRTCAPRPVPLPHIQINQLINVIINKLDCGLCGSGVWLHSN